MKKRFYLVAVLFFAVAGLNIAAAQVSEEELKLKKAERLAIREKMSREEINAEYAQRDMARVPAKRNNENLERRKAENLSSSFVKKSVNSLNAVPEDAIFPIESDEVRAILMTWIYDTYTVSGNQAANPLFEGLGTVGYYSQRLVPVYSVPDVASNSDYAKLFGDLANGIQQHAEVWINIWNADDSTTIKDFMSQRGTPLTNYRFFVHAGNAFWFRDFGPIAFYYGDNDDLAFLDFEYYGGRPLDNDLPIKIAEDLEIPVFTSTIEYEGGNILLDGLGTLVTTTAVYGTNTDDSDGLYVQDPTATNGYYLQEKTPLTHQQVDDSLTEHLKLSKLIVLPKLNYDGGTGHIDLYCDMWEETGFVVSQYPQSMASWSDGQKVTNNLNTLLNTEDFFGNKYFASRVPLPAKNSGSFYSSQSQYNDQYTRAFSNHTFVNDAIVQPVFYDSTATRTSQRGDIDGNLAALEIMKNAYPGYKFEEVDVRSFDGYGGAIHCITKQIPAENPVRIYHQPIRYINTAENPVQYAHLNVLSQNKSGINNVKIFYRYASQTEFSELQCLSMENNMFEAYIPLQPEVAKDTIYYYISSTSNNGKTITKPMTAPLGYYSLVYGTEIEGIVEQDVYGEGSHTWSSLQDKTTVMDMIGEIYPNPASEQVSVTLPQRNDDMYYRVLNLKGQVMIQGKTDKNQSELKLNVSDLKAGNYWLYFTNGNFSAVRKLVIAR
ncbi:MAG: agmatine deiminase family protein [Bacteroidales bacterium]|nr:agmatine deiminase family protein [Bacteroidales bacterium]